MERSKSKVGKLDWRNFNFLENLLLFCVMKERNAPAESSSGVKFRISPNPARQCICLMFHIDRPDDPLIVEENIARPDYLVMFVENDQWICTIIEMKGATEKGFKRGIEQIRVLKDRLTEELKINAPKLRFTFQGIMLVPFGAQIPRLLIEKERANGLTIVPFQYTHKAELFNYISKINSLTDKYKHENVRSVREDTIIEKKMSRYPLSKRISDSFNEEHAEICNKDEGIYINYRESNAEDYSALAIDRDGITIGLKYKDFASQQIDLENEIKAVLSPNKRRLVKIQKID